MGMSSQSEQKINISVCQNTDVLRKIAMEANLHIEQHHRRHQTNYLKNEQNFDYPGPYPINKSYRFPVVRRISFLTQANKFSILRPGLSCTESETDLRISPLHQVFIKKPRSSLYSRFKAHYHLRAYVNEQKL